jgi:hypothetical protein
MVLLQALVSSADMPATLKLISLHEQIWQTGLSGRGSRNILNAPMLHWTPLYNGDNTH